MEDWVSECRVCGFKNYGKELNEECRKNTAREKVEVKIGDKVWIFGNAWQCSRYVGMTSVPEEWTVFDIRYSHPYQKLINSGGRYTSLSTHDPYLILRKSIMSKRGWEPADSGWCEVRIPYKDFLLWQKGDRKELEKAGLVESYWKSILELLKLKIC